MPHPKLELVRRRYNYACGYCGISEISAGGELTVDHYRPIAAGGDDDLDNLVYACLKCNQYKHDFWPNADDLTRQFRVLHPLLDDLSVHLTLNEQTGLVEPLSATGNFHIRLLRLNRSQLTRYRLGQHLQALLLEKQRLLEQQIGELKTTIAAQERYIDLLQTQLAYLQSPQARDD